LNEAQGEIITEDGAVVGRHSGVHNFTIGQRKGLGFAAGKPLYVLSIDPKKIASSSRRRIAPHHFI